MGKPKRNAPAGRPATMAKPSRRRMLSNLSQTRRLQEILLSVDAIAKAEDEFEKGHHAQLRESVASIFEMAVEIRDNEDLQKVFIGNPRTKALERPPRTKGDALRTLFQLSFAKRKQASSIYTALRPFWQASTTPETVRSLVFEHGVYEAASEAGLATPRTKGKGSAESIDAVAKSSAGEDESPPSRSIAQPSLGAPPKRRPDDGFGQTTAHVTTDFCEALQDCHSIGDNVWLHAVWMENDASGLPIFGIEYFE